MDTSIKIPFYAKIALVFISVLSFVFMMSVGQQIIIPIVYAIIIAILLNPLVNYLIRKKINNLLSIAIAVCLAIFVVIGFLYIVSTQVSMLSETYPQLK